MHLVLNLRRCSLSGLGWCLLKLWTLGASLTAPSPGPIAFLPCEILLVILSLLSRLYHPSQLCLQKISVFHNSVFLTNLVGSNDFFPQSPFKPFGYTSLGTLVTSFFVFSDLNKSLISIVIILAA